MSMENGDHNLNFDFSPETTSSIIPEIDIHNPLIFISGAELSSVPIIQLSNLDSIILPQNSSIYEQIVDISADPSVDPVTGEAIVQVINSAVVESLQSLQGFAATPEFEAKMDLAFGNNWDKEANISWPAIRVISSAEIDGANGAFAEATQTIYLSQEFLAQNLENIGEVRNVWLEEFGHSIDSQINIVDAQGDEGKIFSAVVQGKDLDEVDIEVLKGENDRAFVEIDGKTLEIEKDNYQWVDYTIQPEDSLSQIALNTTGNASNYLIIADKNGIDNPDEIDFGDTIKVPRNNSTETNKDNYQWVDYRIQPEDSLSQIALNTTGNASNYLIIADKNGIDNPDEIDFGDTIKVPRNNSTGTNVEVTTRNNDNVEPSLLPRNNSTETNVEVTTRNNDNVEPSLVPRNNSTETTQQQSEPAGGSSDAKRGRISGKVNDNGLTVKYILKAPLIRLPLPTKEESYSGEVILDRYDKDGKVYDRVDNDKDIEGEKNTILVIHGWNDNTEKGYWVDNLSKKAAELYEDQGYQVLALDWSEPAKERNSEWVPITTARFITPVAKWTQETLTNLGIKGENLTLFGHSLGALVSSEIGRLFGKVKNLVALDPPIYSKDYDIDGNKGGLQQVLDFKDVAERSLSFVVKVTNVRPSPSRWLEGVNSIRQLPKIVTNSLSDIVSDSASGIVGSTSMSATAEDSLLIDYEGYSWEDQNLLQRNKKEHKATVNVFKDALSKKFLTLENRFALPPDHLDDMYTRFGHWGNKLMGDLGYPMHEGRVKANINDGTIKRLDYYKGQEISYYPNYFPLPGSQYQTPNIPGYTDRKITIPFLKVPMASKAWTGNN